MSDFEISKEVDGNRGRYVLMKDGDAAELTFSITSPTMVIADHTGVPAQLRASGAGRALVERMVADARAEGFRIVPLCPFVNAERRKHSEWADAFNV